MAGKNRKKNSTTFNRCYHIGLVIDVRTKFEFFNFIFHTYTSRRVRFT